MTSLLWASALAALVDRRLARAAAYLAVAAGASLIGVIHSPHIGSPIGLPWLLADAAGRQPIALCLGDRLPAGGRLALVLVVVGPRRAESPALSDGPEIIGHLRRADGDRLDARHGDLRQRRIATGR